MGMLNLNKINKNVFGLYNQQTKVMFIFFNISKIVLQYYLTLIKTKSKAVSYVSYFLKSLVGFQLISERFMDIFNILFTKKMINQISKLSFFHFFFDVFIVSIKRNKLTAKLRIENDYLDLPEKMKIYKKLDYKPYYFDMYTLYYFYFYFLIDCQLNLTALLNTQELQTYSSLTYYEDMLKPFRLLKKKWAYLGYNSIKELHKFFSYFLEIIFFNLTKNFYKNFYKKKLLNLQTKFMLSNLFGYIYKLNYKNAYQKGNFFFF